MARKRKAETEFSWSDDELQLLLESSLTFKSKCEFEGESWESKRSKYESILDIMMRQYPEDQEKYPNKEKLTKDRVSAKLKTIRTGYRKACDNGRKSGGGRIVFTFYGLCENLWSGSPAVTSISNAIDSQQQLSSTALESQVPDGSPIQLTSFEDGDEEADSSTEEASPTFSSTFNIQASNSASTSGTTSEETTKRREMVSDMLKNRKDKKMTSRLSTENQLLQLTQEDIAFKKKC